MFLGLIIFLPESEGVKPFKAPFFERGWHELLTKFYGADRAYSSAIASVDGANHL